MSKIDELKKLAELKEKGAISEDEFQKLKTRMLTSPIEGQVEESSSARDDNADNEDGGQKVSMVTVIGGGFILACVLLLALGDPDEKASEMPSSNSANATKNSTETLLESEALRAVKEKWEEPFIHAGVPVQICNSVEDARIVKQTSKVGTASRFLRNSWDAQGVPVNAPMPAGLFVVQYTCVNRRARTKDREYTSVFLAINSDFDQLECRYVSYESSKTDSAYIDPKVRDVSMKCGFKESPK